MKKSAFFSDIIFTFLLVWLFTLCVFRYLKTALFPALLLSAVCGVLAAGAVAALLHGKRKTAFLKKTDEALKQKLLLHLALVSDEQKTRLFTTALSKTVNVRRQNKLLLRTDDTAYFLRFRFSPVTADEVARMSRWKTANEKVLFCSEIEENALSLCRKLGIRAETGESVYRFLKKNGCLPENYAGEETPVGKRKRLARVCFAKSNARRFLVSGALLLVTSLLTPFPYYYLVFGGILLLVALLIRILGKDG